MMFLFTLAVLAAIGGCVTLLKPEAFGIAPNVRSKIGSVATVVAAVAAMFLVWPSLVGQTNTSGTDRKPASGTRAALSEDPLQQMELAFTGNPPVSEIQPLLERAMRLYGLEVNDENRQRAGSALVALRREIGVPEMEILDYMVRSYVEGVELEFADAAAISASFLATGDQ